MVAPEASLEIRAKLSWVARETSATIEDADVAEDARSFQAIFEISSKLIRFEWNVATEILVVAFIDDGTWKEDARISLPDAVGLYEEMASEIVECSG